MPSLANSSQGSGDPIVDPESLTDSLTDIGKRILEGSGESSFRSAEEQQADFRQSLGNLEEMGRDVLRNIGKPRSVMRGRDNEPNQGPVGSTISPPGTPTNRQQSQQTSQNTSTGGGGGGSFGPGDTIQQSAQTPQQEVTGGFGMSRIPAEEDVGNLFGDFRTSPTDQATREPNVQPEEDAGAISASAATQTPPQAQRQNDYQETLSAVEQRAKGLLDELNRRDDVDMSPQSRPVRETEEQRQMVEQADDPDTLRQRMDEAREQFNMPELEKRRRQISNQLDAEREAFNRTIQEVKDQDHIFGAMERRRVENLETQRDQRIQSLTNLEDTITEQIDSINTRVNQEVQAEQVRGQREQQRQQEGRQRVSELVDANALGEFDDQQISQLAEQSGFSETALRNIQQAQQRAPQVDATGQVGQYQDAMSLGIISEDTTFDQFLQATRGGGGGENQRLQEFVNAQNFVNQNAGMGEAELERNLRAQYGELRAGDIDAIIKTRNKPDMTEEDLLRKYAKSVQSLQTRGMNRQQARQEARRNIRDNLNLNQDEELPSFYDDKIDQAVTSVYGNTPLWHWIPGLGT